MLAMRVGESQFEPDLPLSGRIRADIGPDGIPHMLEGKILVDKGVVIDLDDPLARIPIDRAEINLDWDATRQALVMPFQVLSGGNRITLLAQFDAPREGSSVWGLQVSGGTVVLASAAPADQKPLVLDRVALRMRVDPAKQRIDLDPSELGNADLGVALTGSLDFSSDDPRLVLGIAGTRMSVAAMKLLWPICTAPKVRAWVQEHVLAGTVDRLDISTNAPWSTLKASGPPVPDDGLLIQIVGNGAEVRPVAGLPAIRDADVNLRISGRTAVINVGRGNVEISPGRKLSITNGVFEVPDTFPKAPPAKARFRLDGSVPAAAELLGMERLRDYSGAPIDPATSRGTLTAQVTLALPLKEDLAPGSSIYTINLDIANFVAERMVMGQKVEAALLKVSANNQGHWIRGDVKINGVPAALDYRKPRDADADVRIQATLDESGRSKLGFDLSGFLMGPVPIKLSGRIPAQESDTRFAIEADLTQAKVDNLLPGWSKAAGRAARATFTLVNKSPGTRFEDLVVEAPGASVKGAIEVDGSGDVVSANFPVFSLSDGDKATLKADRSADGTLRVTVRGDVYDGRGFIKSTMSGGGASNRKQKHDKDIDLDLKLGAVVGFHGETLRGLDLKLSRRSGAITSLAVNGKLGRDAPLTGDLRGRGTNGRQVVFVETNDAGAFFRFSDIYPKIFGGEMWVALDPHSADTAPQEGILNIRDFAVRGEVRARPRRRGAATAGRSAAGRGLLPPAGGFHPLARTLHRSRWPGEGARDRRDRRRLHRLQSRRRAHAGHLRPALRPQQYVRPDPDRGAVPWRQQRGLAGRHLSGGRPAEHAGAAGQSDIGRGARPAAQVLRIPERQRRGAAELRRAAELGGRRRGSRNDMSAPSKTDATTPCPHCAGTMTISMIGPLPEEPALMSHTFACPTCGHSATFKFKKKDAA